MRVSSNLFLYSRSLSLTRRILHMENSLLSNVRTHTSDSKPILFAFDFDSTLSVRSSCFPIQELAPDQKALNLDDINRRYQNSHYRWNRRMNEVIERLSEQGIDSKQLLHTFRNLELSPGTHELFRALAKQNHHIIIVSDAWDLLIDECLRANGLFDLVHKIETNRVRQIDPIMIIDDYDNQTACNMCPPNLCKGLVLDRYRETNLYRKIIFIGDGDNDVCPALHLVEGDFAFARHDEKTPDKFPMYGILKEKHMHQLKAEVCLWNTMEQVQRVLKIKQII